VALLLYASFLMTPKKGPPQYLIDLEERVLSASQPKASVYDEPDDGPDDYIEVTKPVPIYRETVNNEVMDEYNDYKRKCATSKEPPKGLTAWLRVFDPDLARRLNDD
jgi:hypothetical protein